MIEATLSAGITGAGGSSLFATSCLFTAVALVLIGLLKGVVTEQKPLRGTAETVLLGGAAATIAYFVGDILEKLL